MEDVQIRVYNKQTYSTHSDEAENVLQGKMAVKDNDLYVIYKDEETQTNTNIKVTNKGIVVKRSGATNGTLQFDKEKITRSIYGTPYGNMIIDIETTQIETYLLEKGIKIYIEYKMIIEGEKVSDNIFLIIAN